MTGGILAQELNMQREQSPQRGFTGFITESNFNEYIVKRRYAEIKTKTKSDTCSICIDEFQLEDEIRQIFVCRHIFHDQCIREWIKKSPNCPNCKLPLTRENLQGKKFDPMASGDLFFPDEMLQKPFTNELEELNSQKKPKTPKESQGMSNRSSSKMKKDSKTDMESPELKQNQDSEDNKSENPEIKNRIVQCLSEDFIGHSRKQTPSANFRPTACFSEALEPSKVDQSALGLNSALAKSENFGRNEGEGMTMSREFRKGEDLNEIGLMHSVTLKAQNQKEWLKKNSSSHSVNKHQSHLDEEFFSEDLEEMGHHPFQLKPETKKRNLIGELPGSLEKEQKSKEVYEVLKIGLGSLGATGSSGRLGERLENEKGDEEKSDFQVESIDGERNDRFKKEERVNRAKIKKIQRGINLKEESKGPVGLVNFSLETPENKGEKGGYVDDGYQEAVWEKQDSQKEEERRLGKSKSKITTLKPEQKFFRSKTQEKGPNDETKKDNNEPKENEERYEFEEEKKEEGLEEQRNSQNGFISDFKPNMMVADSEKTLQNLSGVSISSQGTPNSHFSWEKSNVIESSSHDLSSSQASEAGLLSFTAKEPSLAGNELKDSDSRGSFLLSGFKFNSKFSLGSIFSSSNKEKSDKKHKKKEIEEEVDEIDLDFFKENPSNSKTLKMNDSDLFF